MHFYSSCIALRASSTGFNSHIFVDQHSLQHVVVITKQNLRIGLGIMCYWILPTIWLSIISMYSWCWAQKPTTNTERVGHNPLFTPSNHPALPVKHYVQVQLDSIGYNSHISVDHQQLAACHNDHRANFENGLGHHVLLDSQTMAHLFLTLSSETRDSLQEFGIQFGTSGAKLQHIWTSLETWSTSLTGNMTTGRYEVGFFTSASFVSASPSTDTARTWRPHLLFSPM